VGDQTSHRPQMMDGVAILSNQRNLYGVNIISFLIVSGPLDRYPLSRHSPRRLLAIGQSGDVKIKGRFEGGRKWGEEVSRVG